MSHGVWILLTKVENDIPKTVEHEKKGTESGNHRTGVRIGNCVLLERRVHAEARGCSGKVILGIVLGVRVWDSKSKFL